MLNRNWVVSTATTMIFALMLLPLGCSKAKAPADQAAEKVAETAFNVDGQDVQVKIDSSEGTVSIKGGDENEGLVISSGKDLKVPADFPKDVPLYPGLAINMASKQAADNAYVLSGTTTEDITKVEAFYRDKMKGNDWTEEKMPFQMQGMAMLIFKKDTRTVNMNIMAENGVTQVVCTVVEEGAE